ncbi:hypothetical protein K458DRAFT_427981 [Lentithecium fluviatile CBS 122367]|uniref:Uncharacterized protein n=1 Tax=Lentithecium fluviatile CBS 122367 TaxID=1168545 RepID=A0A6G1JE35_9PLEO|nr:hypothetical protein K458DRAFT_427981 [Lentithecium fluviatile CBS 122367]
MPAVWSVVVEPRSMDVNLHSSPSPPQSYPTSLGDILFQDACSPLMPQRRQNIGVASTGFAKPSSSATSPFQSNCTIAPARSAPPIDSSFITLVSLSALVSDPTSTTLVNIIMSTVVDPT